MRSAIIAAILFILSGIRILGDIDFAITRINDPGWIGKVWSSLIFFLMSPPYWFTAILIIGGLMFAWYAIYISRQSRPKKSRQITWDFTGNYLSLSSRRQSTGTSEDIMLYGDIEYRINQFQVRGKNNSNNPIDNISGYVRSDKTNLKIPILLEGMPPEETHGIPGKCEFWVRAIFPRSTKDKEGYTIEDYWRHFGEFTFVFEFDSNKYEKRFSRKEIENLLDKQKQEADNGLIPTERPRVKAAQNEAQEAPENGYISLSEVSRMAADKHRSPDDPYYLDFVGFNEGFSEGYDEEILNKVAKAIAHSVDIFGVHQTGSKRIRVDLGSLKLGNGLDYFGDNGNTIYRGERGGFIPKPRQEIWLNICIRTYDIDKALNEIPNYTD